jgi:hypothetical protein
MESNTDSRMSMQYWFYQNDFVVNVFPTVIFCQTLYEFDLKLVQREY